VFAQTFFTFNPAIAQSAINATANFTPAPININRDFLFHCASVWLLKEPLSSNEAAPVYAGHLIVFTWEIRHVAVRIRPGRFIEEVFACHSS
jgi:hypothetical protein